MASRGERPLPARHKGEVREVLREGIEKGGREARAPDDEPEEGWCWQVKPLRALPPRCVCVCGGCPLKGHSPPAAAHAHCALRAARPEGGAVRVMAAAPLRGEEGEGGLGVNK